MIGYNTKCWLSVLTSPDPKRQRKSCHVIREHEKSRSRDLWSVKVQQVQNIVCGLSVWQESAPQNVLLIIKKYFVKVKGMSNKNMWLGTPNYKYNNLTYSDEALEEWKDINPHSNG